MLDVKTDEVAEQGVLLGHSRYIVFNNGCVFNKLSGKFLKGSKNPAGYINFRLTDDTGRTKTFGRHRLLCLVFKPTANENSQLVNHVNGIKGFDELSNLEWVTALGNVHHAGLNGLTKKCIPVSVKDSVTGEVKKYNSVKDCSVDLGLTKDAILHRLTKSDQYIFSEKKQYRKGHYIDDWVTPVEENGQLKIVARDKSIFVKNLITNKIEYFETMSDFCSKYDISLSTLSCWMKKHYQPVLPGFLQVKLVKDNNKWRYVQDPLLEISLLLNTRSVQVTNTITKTVEYFVSASECCSAYKMKPTLLNYRLNQAKQKQFDNLIFEYIHFNNNSPDS